MTGAAPGADEILAVLGRVVEGLQRLEIRFFLTGSFASGIHGVYRQTADADLVVQIASRHVQPMLEEFGGDFYLSEASIFRALDHGSAFNAIHLETGFKVDFFPLKPRERAALDRVVLVPILGEGTSPVPVSSPEDSILSKLEWFRLGGESSDRQWSDLRGLLETASEDLDREYIEAQAEACGILDLFHRLQGEVGDR